jgi:hypothetical protein
MERCDNSLWDIGGFVGWGAFAYARRTYLFLAKALMLDYSHRSDIVERDSGYRYSRGVAEARTFGEMLLYIQDGRSEFSVLRPSYI